MVERHWKGIAFREKADHYVDHLKTDTLPKLKSITGFKGLSILSRQTEEGVAFMVITRWDSLDAILQFAGADYTVAVVPDAVKAIMIRYDLQAEHYETIL